MNDAMNETFAVKNGSEEVNASLAELLNIDMSTVEAIEGFKKTPRGNYVWQIQATSGGDSIAGKPVIVVRCVAISCTRFIDENGNDLDPALGVGSEHDELFFINDLEMGLGRFKFFLESAGMQATASAAINLAVATGGMFNASVMWQRDKTDKDKIYSRLDKVEPAQAAVATAAGIGAPTPAAIPAQQTAAATQVAGGNAQVQVQAAPLQVQAAPLQVQVAPTV